MKFAAKRGEVPNSGKKVVTVDNREILLVQVKGQFYAFENECPHQGAPMNAAIVKDTYISCPRHGYRFNLADGKCTDHPEFTMTVIPVTVDGEDLLVDL